MRLKLIRLRSVLGRGEMANSVSRVSGTAVLTSPRQCLGVFISSSQTEHEYEDSLPRSSIHGICLLTVSHRLACGGTG